MNIQLPIIGANWKMNKTLEESISTANALCSLLDQLEDRTVFINVPYTTLGAVKDIFHSANILVGAQDVHWEDWGAYTGEISAPMLKDAGADVVMTGHSERREFFGETDLTVNLKLKAILKHNLVPVVCTGENIDVREADQTREFLTAQLTTCLDGVNSEDIANLIIAYEPIWAIGTGLPLQPEQASEAHNVIRTWLNEKFGSDTAHRIHVICGGSITFENAAALGGMPDVDGLFIGGASLNAFSFAQIVYWDKPEKLIGKTSK